MGSSHRHLFTVVIIFSENKSGFLVKIGFWLYQLLQSPLLCRIEKRTLKINLLGNFTPYYTLMHKIVFETLLLFGLKGEVVIYSVLMVVGG